MTDNVAVAAEEKSKITLKIFGAAKAALKSAPAGAKSVLLGSLIGVAEKIKSKTDVRGETFDVLLGSFEAVTGGKVVSAEVLALPGSFHASIAECVQHAGSAVFAFGVYAVAHDSGARLALLPIAPPAGRGDPLAALRDAVEAHYAPIPAPASEAVQDAAPASDPVPAAAASKRRAA